jgi:apolipoprotein N-acyltransferase
VEGIEVRFVVFVAATMRTLALGVSLGACAGAAFGWSCGWLVALLSQAALISLLCHTSKPRSSQITVLIAAWALGMYGAGYAGFVLGVPEAMRSWALVVCSLYVAGQALVCAMLAAVVQRVTSSNKLRWLVLWPLAWMGFEWAMSVGTLAMPWLRLGQVQAPDGPFAAALPVGGTLLASALMWISAAVTASMLKTGFAKLTMRRQAGSGTERRPAHGMAILVVIAVIGAWATISPWVWTTPTGELPVALIQPGRASSEWAGSAHRSDRENGERALLTYYLEAASAAARSGARLIVTPQLALPKTLTAIPPSYIDALEQPLSREGSDLLLGVYFDASDDALYNGLLAVGASGEQRYLKQQPFPFGEYVPLRGAVRDALDRLMGRSIQDAARGPAGQGRLHLAASHVAATVCFEAAFPQLWREAASTSELITNLSSDSALNSAQLNRQVRQMLQARAMEFQKPIVRSSDVDGTYVIDATGRVADELESRTKGTLHAMVGKRSGLTPFARFGDAAAAGALVFLLVVGGLAARWGSQSRSTSRPTYRDSRHSKTGRALRTQQGQVMLPGIVLILITGGLMYLMVNSGQAVNEKVRVTNAADAAAYSAGVVEARALNYDAYMNRAIIANQMAIAQAVSVASWLQYVANLVDYGIYDVSDEVLFMFAPPVSAEDAAKVAQVGGTAAGLAYLLAYTGSTATEWAELIVYYGLMPAIYISDIVAQALSVSQEAMHASLIAGIRQGQIADDVVQAIDPALDAEVVLVSHGFDKFTKAYAGDERERLAGVSMRSRGLFTRERNWTAESIDIPVVRKDGAMKKRAGTDLVGYDEWRGLDTLELHGRHFGCGKIGLSWCDDVRMPAGWGGMYASTTGEDQGRGYHGNAYGENETTAERAESDMFEAGFSGLPSTRDLADLDSDAPLDTGITVMVEKAHADTRTSGNGALAHPSGRLELFGERPAGQRMVALSRASVYFDRIEARADGKTEIASTYNPYWRVRLVAPTAADKAYAAGRQDGLFLP